MIQSIFGKKGRKNLKITLKIKHLKNSMEVPQKVKNRIAIFFNNSTSGYLFKKNRNQDLKEIAAPQCSLQHIHNRQDVKQPKCTLTDDCIKKM